MDPLEPETPPPAPPSPPRPEWIQPQPARPATPALTPIMDFFQRRVEALERDLALERERGQAAQNLLGQQEALKSEVDKHLKAISEQLRREKQEREGDEARSHARGRIEALEQRLDEMNATFAQLLKEAVARREAEGQSTGALSAEFASLRAFLTEAATRRPPQDPALSAVPAEIASIRGALKDALEGIARWRDELRGLGALAPKVEELSARLTSGGKLVEESVSRRLEESSARLTRALEDLKRAQEAERARLDERVEAMARERADLARLWDDQARAAREQQSKEGTARDAELTRQITGLAARLEALGPSQQAAAQGAQDLREELERVLKFLSASPKAKDEMLAALEAEKTDLATALRQRNEELRRFAAERREVEKSVADECARLTTEVEAERAKTREASAHASEAGGRAETLAARLADLERAIADRDERLRALNEQRDELTRSLVAESEKVRQGVAERRDADAAATAREAELQKRLDEETTRRSTAEIAVAEVRSQMGALAGQSARSLQERDAALARFADWERERQRLIDTLRKKDEMIALLSATFQGVMKKEG